MHWSMSWKFLQGKKKKVISAWVQSKKKGLFCALNDLEKPLFTHVAH